jgi:phosphopantetheinyl transferase
MSNIDSVLREINRELVPQFEEKRRADNVTWCLKLSTVKSKGKGLATALLRL